MAQVGIGTTDHNGFLAGSVCGESPIRISAEEIFFDEKTNEQLPRVSAPIELQIDDLAKQVNLVLSSENQPRYHPPEGFGPQ